MASVRILIVAAVLVGCANAKFVWEPDTNDDFPAFKPFKMQMPVPPTPPQLPFPPFPSFQNFAPFQPIRPIQPFAPNAFNFPMPHIISADEIKNAKPGPNGVYNGVMVSSSSNSYVDKDGKVVKKGGTSVLTNQDGKVQEWKQGNAPPDLNKPIQMPKFEPITFDPIEPIEFEPIKFDPIEPIKIDDIKNHKPGKGEKYSAYSVSASKSTKTVNGKVVEDKAASSVLTNDNGKVDQQHAGYNKGEKEPRRNK
ncbi:seroin-like isoform X1 [Cydia pomonella]|uniref:seroin-like isoform X1 n=2 Tax=Cydia pomonella TaxID=82600 RepID=UPI002ADDF855|nr:seroin-like isoform X1 [Cydia pomonella]